MSFESDIRARLLEVEKETFPLSRGDIAEGAEPQLREGKGDMLSYYLLADMAASLRILAMKAQER